MDINIIIKIFIIIVILYFFYYFSWYSTPTKTTTYPTNNFAGNLPNILIKDYDKYKDPIAIKNLSCYYGITKCPAGSSCDCNSLCKSDDFMQFTAEIGQEVFYNNKKLEEGYTYCLPKTDDTNQCQKQTQVILFTSTGFRCIDKYPHIIKDKKITACISKDGSINNPLWDYKLNRKIENVIGSFDPYEIMENGQNRYGCKCIYNDDMGNTTKYLPEIDPFSCFEDPCLSNNSKTLAKGYVDGNCDCKPLNLDEVSLKCTTCVRGINKSYYNCAALDSVAEKAISHFMCPPKYVEDAKQLCVNFTYDVYPGIDWRTQLNV